MDVLASLDILAIIGAKHLAQVYLQWLSLCAEMRLLFTQRTVCTCITNSRLGRRLIIF
jgi:hypothetical protein